MLLRYSKPLGRRQNEAQRCVRPERPKAALLGSRRASRAGARSTHSLGPIGTFGSRTEPGLSKSVMMLLRALLAASLLIGLSTAASDDKRGLPTIGLAIPVDPQLDAPNQAAFREGLQDLGWVDGRNVRLIVRYANADPAKYREIIQELIALRVDVLWGEARELLEATNTIPIVSPTMDFGDPVRTGLVKSLRRPGGNLTGPATQREDLDPKLLQLSKELLPGLRRLCVVFDGDPKRKLAEYVNGHFRSLANQVGVDVCAIPVLTLDDIQALPRAIARERAQAVMLWTTAFTYQHHRSIVASVPHPLPVITDAPSYVAAGAVLSYSVDWINTFRRSAAYVDKILKGAKPGDLPIEQPTQFRLIVNMKSAEALGIMVPESIMVRADDRIR